VAWRRQWFYVLVVFVSFCLCWVRKANVVVFLLTLFRVRSVSWWYSLGVFGLLWNLQVIVEEYCTVRVMIPWSSRIGQVTTLWHIVGNSRLRLLIGPQSNLLTLSNVLATGVRNHFEILDHACKPQTVGVTLWSWCCADGCVGLSTFHLNHNKQSQNYNIDNNNIIITLTKNSSNICS
jgi:hypothetical protein